MSARTHKFSHCKRFDSHNFHSIRTKTCSDSVLNWTQSNELGRSKKKKIEKKSERKTKFNLMLITHSHRLAGWLAGLLVYSDYYYYNIIGLQSIIAIAFDLMLNIFTIRFKRIDWYFQSIFFPFTSSFFLSDKQTLIICRWRMMLFNQTRWGNLVNGAYEMNKIDFTALRSFAVLSYGTLVL